MTETVLVTGGTGYVAGWVIVELLERGYAVRTTVRSESSADRVRTAVDTRTDPGERLTFAIADLTPILPGAVLGPILTTANLGSVRMVKGAMPGTPRIGLEIVDVRDLADLHIRAMTAPEAAGQRFLATGEFTWMREMSADLRAGLGPAGRRVPTRQLPDFLVRISARFDPSLRAITVSLGA